VLVALVALEQAAPELAGQTMEQTDQIPYFLQPHLQVVAVAVQAIPEVVKVAVPAVAVLVDL
jgi:hypothetical protein